MPFGLSIPNANQLRTKMFQVSRRVTTAGICNGRVPTQTGGVESKHFLIVPSVDEQTSPTNCILQFTTPTGDTLWSKDSETARWLAARANKTFHLIMTSASCPVTVAKFPDHSSVTRSIWHMAVDWTTEMPSEL